MSEQPGPALSSPDAQPPDFGRGVAHLREACGPRDLYCRLLELEENVHYLEPAFRFAAGALQASPADGWTSEPHAEPAPEFLEGLLRRATAECGPVPLEGAASSWPERVAREFAPLGLLDGVWLQGLVQFNRVESPVGMAALGQLMFRFAGPGVGESHAERYAALLRGLGILPASLSRWEAEPGAPCADISYEHALLGVCLSLFPSTFTPETVGFNLWMTAIGPCPLLERLAGALRPRAGASWFDAPGRQALIDLARTAALALLTGEDGDTGETRSRIARGFNAAHRSYKRWELAMLGGNVPRTPRECVLELLGRKAHFATGHHPGLGNLESLFAAGRAGHEALLEQLAASHLIRPGAPDRSPFLQRSIDFGGPMFGVFTDAEQQDLREWIASLPDAGGTSPAAPVALEGVYAPPQDPVSLRNHALAHYGVLPPQELLYRLLNADRYPAVRLFGRVVVENAFGLLARTLDGDARLDSTTPPRYSEQLLAELVAENHARNVRTRSQKAYECPGQDAPAAADPEKPTPSQVGRAPGAPLDGCWLGGFADAHRIAQEEYGWLFRIYAGELGDGRLEWNHNYILRRMNIECGMPAEQALIPLWDRRLYDFIQVSFADIIMVALSLNTRHFLPELLGLNLFIEAKGVGGYYLTTMKSAERRGLKWTALSMRIHNTIDNYATGHTRWSVAAIQAFMARVRDATPQAQEAQWRRIWRLWRFNELRDYGTDAQKQALEERLGAVATDSFVPSAA